MSKEKTEKLDRELKLPVSEIEIKFVEYPTGEVLELMEKDSKTSFMITNNLAKQKDGFRKKKKKDIEVESQRLEIKDNIKLETEYIEYFVESAKDKKGKKIDFDYDAFKKLAKPDYDLVKKKIKELTSGVDFF